jgi:hypothetical protein
MHFLTLTKLLQTVSGYSELATVLVVKGVLKAMWNRQDLLLDNKLCNEAAHEPYETHKS